MENKPNTNWILWIAVGLIALGLLKPDFLKNLTSGGGEQTVENVEDEPSAALQKLVKGLKGEVSGPDAAEISQFYSDFAVVLSGIDDDKLPSKAAFDQAYQQGGLIMFTRLGMKDKYSGLAEKIDGILAKQLGLDNTAFEKDKAIEVLNAISWGIQQ